MLAIGITALTAAARSDPVSGQGTATDRSCAVSSEKGLELLNISGIFSSIEAPAPISGGVSIGYYRI
jgi:hypothetical protein